MYIKNSRPKPDFLHYNHNQKPSHCCFFIRTRILGCKRSRTKLQISKRWSSFFAICRHFSRCPEQCAEMSERSPRRYAFFRSSQPVTPLLYCATGCCTNSVMQASVLLRGLLLQKKEGARLRPPCLCGAFDRPLSGTVKPISPTYGTSTAECLLRRRSYEV